MSRLADFFKTGGQYEHSPMMHVQDQKPNGTDGGASAAGTVKRDLNTVLNNDIVGASLSANDITLPAGTYYIEANAVSYQSNRHSNYLYDATSAATLLESLNGYSGALDNTSASPVMAGEIVLTQATVLELYTETSTAKATYGLGVALSHGDHETYSSIKIWQLDAIKTSPIIHDNKLYPLPGNTYVTGDMYGLEYSYAGANSITVDAGICYDSLNTTLLTGSASQAVAIGTTINQIYNLFLCDDGVVRTDTFVDGDSLGAYKIRWIGFVITDSAGNIINFKNIGNQLTWHSATRPVVASSITTAWVEYNLSNLIPVTRLVDITLWWNIAGAYISYDGVTGINRAATDDEQQTILSSSSVYMQYWNSNPSVKILSVTLKR